MVKPTVKMGRRSGLVLRALTLLAALIFLARGVHWVDITAAARRAGFVLPALVVAINGCMMSVKAVRLRLLLRNPQISFGACFFALLTSSAINNITPFRGGDVARLWMLEQAGGVTKSAALAIAVVENLVQLLVLAAIGFFASLAVSGQNWATIAAPVVFFGATGLLVLLRLTTERAAVAVVAARGNARASRLSVWIQQFFKRLEPGARALSEPGLAARAVGLSLVAWMCEGVMVVLSAHAMGLSVSFWLAALILFGINLALALPSTPAGAGPFEGAAAAVLILAGVAKGPAVAFALLYHAVQVIPVTIVGVAVLSRLGMTLKGLPARSDWSPQARGDVAGGIESA